MATVLLVLHLSIVTGFTLRILLRDDYSPQARLAWFLVLAVLPYVGGIIYFLFGANDLGRRADERHEKVFAQIRATETRFMGKSDDVDRLIDPHYRPAFRYAGSINGFHPVAGNSADLMADAAATTAHLIADIDAARRHVHVLYYIWLDDRTGTDVAHALIRAAKRGVICRAMADGLGSRAMIKSPLWQQMQEAGVRLAVALPFDKLIRTVLTSRVDLRNHRKITVIDSTITYCGSRNCADPEFLVKAKYAPWVDVMMRFEGPIVAQNELLFLSDWMQATGEGLDDFSPAASPARDGFPAQVVGVGPTERPGATPQLFSTLIACAQDSLTLSTPYFVPDTTVLEALCSAAHRGVETTLIFPKVNDSWIVAAASRSYYGRLLSAGCRIHEFKGGLLHAKTLTLDGMVTLIGSSNLDLRSFDLNYESNILLQDRDVTSAVRDRQKNYIERSDPVTRDTVAAWPRYRRVWNNAIATVGPVL
ncbi:cardiolipin synthase [Palleronia aestuarii]|uniref:Cardiolipin synthase n=1 Tax=Palleronia aestuarii TaxID=568105 RepID=A0A2W7NDI2_9RHOB|nr:cardiolipin synthase [Palleronia aestuarii]PZX18208.1 cardiolipin synthase [Palleronia aestuarii]